MAESSSMTAEKHLAACRACGRRFQIDELDSKPERGADPETADYTRLECRDCYGPGYCEL